MILAASTQSVYLNFKCSPRSLQTNTGANACLNSTKTASSRSRLSVIVVPTIAFMYVPGAPLAPWPELSCFEERDLRTIGDKDLTFGR